MTLGTYLFLQTLWLQQMLGMAAAGLSLWGAIACTRAYLRVACVLGTALWLCVAVRAFIAWGIWMASK